MTCRWHAPWAPRRPCQCPSRDQCLQGRCPTPALTVAGDHRQARVPEACLLLLWPYQVRRSYQWVWGEEMKPARKGRTGDHFGTASRAQEDSRQKMPSCARSTIPGSGPRLHPTTVTQEKHGGLRPCAPEVPRPLAMLFVQDKGAMSLRVPPPLGARSKCTSGRRIPGPRGTVPHCLPPAMRGRGVNRWTHSLWVTLDLSFLFCSFIASNS